MQKWKKLGLIFNPRNYDCPDWMTNYAAVPFIHDFGNDKVRVYFTARNQSNKSLTGWADFNWNNLFGGPLSISKKPILDLGRKGMFDEDGIMGCHITKINNKSYFYYIGWNLAVSVPFRNSIGVAIEREEGGFSRYSEGPIVDRNIYDKCFVASNCIYAEKDFFRLYYLSCDVWIDNEIPRHKYLIKYAESKDGLNWIRNGKIAIDFQNDREYAISVPRVIKDDNIYKMWYSYRGSNESPNYRIGYAESKDAKNWERKDDLIKFAGPMSDWDSEMMCYPFIFDYNKERYMLYNGNNYGQTGFGLAILTK